jgi:hypothetical protein
MSMGEQVVRGRKRKLRVKVWKGVMMMIGVRWVGAMVR